MSIVTQTFYLLWYGMMLIPCQFHHLLCKSINQIGINLIPIIIVSDDASVLKWCACT